MRHPLILTTGKKGHYRAWGDFLKELILGIQPDRVVEVKERGSLSEILGAPTLLLLDVDGSHLVLLPLIILRSILGRSTIMLGVRSEDVLTKRFKSWVKRRIHRVLMILPRCEIVSIHRGVTEDALRPYISLFIYDIQYWDLYYLFPGYQAPAECARLDPENMSICIVPGGMNYKRNPEELRSFVSANPELQFIIAGLSEKAAVELLAPFDNVLFINRYISDQELMWLYRAATSVWAVYANDVKRPSGIFGRGIQFGRYVFVRKDGFLQQYYGHYSRTVPLNDFSVPCELDDAGIDHSGSLSSNTDFDDCPALKRLLNDALR